VQGGYESKPTFVEEAEIGAKESIRPDRYGSMGKTGIEGKTHSYIFYGKPRGRKKKIRSSGRLRKGRTKTGN